MKSLIFLLLFTTQAFATISLPSQRRLPNETYHQALQRYYLRLNLLDEQQQPDSAFGTSIKMHQVDDEFKKRLPEFASSALLKEAFEWSRDLRFMEDPEFENFPRRISWLYPDDGCFARAQVAQKKIRDHMKGSDLGKVFIFGDLNVKTKNSPDGEVSWWYHVVPAVRINNEIWVLDAAIQPKSVLKLEEWIATMIAPDDKDFKINFCKNESYGPSDSCLHPREMSMDDALQSQSYYLSDERERLIEMKRNPDEELGDNPPWFKSEQKQSDKHQQPQDTPRYLMQ